MIRLSSIALATALIVLGPTSPIDAQQTPDLLNRAAARYEQIDGMCAHFEQRLEIPLLGNEVLSEGRLCTKQPAYFRMDFTEPDGDAVVADGKDLWVYFPSTQPGQVLRSPLGDGAAVDFTREFLTDPGRKYEATDEGLDNVAGQSTRRFALDPIVEGLGYSHARVWIDTDRAIIRRVEIHQENGSVRHLTLTSIDLDPGMVVADFVFDGPADVHIVSIGGDARDN